jgi:hypothetical protein
LSPQYNAKGAPPLKYSPTLSQIGYPLLRREKSYSTPEAMSIRGSYRQVGRPRRTSRCDIMQERQIVRLNILKKEV